MMKPETGNNQLARIRKGRPTLTSATLQLLYPNFGKTAATRHQSELCQTGKTDLAGLTRRFAWDQTFTLGVFASQFTGAAHSFSLFAGTLFRWLFIEIPQLRFTEDAFALQLLFQSAEGLINIVVTYDDLHGLFPFFRFIFRDQVCARPLKDNGNKQGSRNPAGNRLGLVYPTFAPLSSTDLVRQGRSFAISGG